jgi:ABC-2 type transport system permease protein
MGTLLKIEWLKVKKYKAFWIIFGFLMILFPSVTMAFGRLAKNFDKGGAIDTVLGGPFDFNTVFFNAAYLNNGLNIAWGMLLILMIGNEFQSRTIRQNVIDGQQRNDIITSKLILVVIFSFISAVLLMISALLAGTFYAHNSFHFDVDLLEVFGTFFFASFMQMLFALVFAFIIKRPAIAVILYLGYTVFVENILVLILVAIFKSSYPRLWFTQSADELTTVALTKEIPMDGSAFPYITPESAWIACVIYAGLILFFLYRYINRTILK